jgi:hypothetical protein
MRSVICWLPGLYKRIWEIRDFLKNQRKDLPSVSVIYSGKFNDKLALLKVSEHFYQDKNTDNYQPQYFVCTPGLDCDYLNKFLSGATVDPLRLCNDKKLAIYMPIVTNPARFVLLFERVEQFGNFGS